MRYIEHRLRVTLFDGRQMVGTFLAFDKHLNLVLSDAQEYRSSKKSGATAAAVVEERTEQRNLGLILVRGDNVVSVAVEGPPPATTTTTSASTTAAPGPGQVATGVGRGQRPMGLGAVPVHGAVGMPPPPPPPGGAVGGGMGRGMPPPPSSY